MESTSTYFDDDNTCSNNKQEQTLKEEGLKMKMIVNEEEDEQQVPLLVSMEAPNCTKGGFKTIPFILVNESFERVASYGIPPNMIKYLMNEYHVKVTTGNNILLYWSAATNFLPVLGALLADSFFGRFWMIGVGSIFSLLGMILLWSTTIIPQTRPPSCDESSSSCIPSTLLQLLFLCSSFALISLGAGGIRSSSAAFGANQLGEQEINLTTPGALQKYFNWYTAASSLSVVIALSVIVYIQDHMGWKVGFGVPALLMFFSAFAFFLASPCYIKLKSKASLLPGLCRVVVAWYENRDLALPTEGETVVYHHREDSKSISPSDKLRFLNKACIVRDLQGNIPTDEITNKSYTICTVDEVEEFKTLLKVIPIWSTGVIMSINSGQPSLPLLQAMSMDRHITSSFEFPAASFGMLSVLFITIWVAFYDWILIPLASKIIRKPVHFTAKQRMGMGIFVSFLSMTVSGIVEANRRVRANNQGSLNDNLLAATLQMSAWWLVPTHCLNGIADGLNIIAQYEFYYSEFPGSMSSIAMNVQGVGLAFSNVLASFLLNAVDAITSRGGRVSWISSDIDHGHYDYYCWFLAGLSLLNFMYYLVCSRAYGPSKGEGDTGERVLILT